MAWHVCTGTLARAELREGGSVCSVQSLGVIEGLRGLPSMTSALEGGEGVVEKWTRVLISCVIMYVTRGGEGVKKFDIFMDVIDGSPLTDVA